jgi:hypothetical protein
LSPPNNPLRDRLLAAEPATPALRQRYEQEIQNMLEKKLTGARRWVWLVGAIGGLVLAVAFGTLSVTVPYRFPLPGRIGFAGGALFCLGWVLLGWRIFRRGAIDLKFDTWAYSALAWALPLFMLTIFMVSAPNNLMGLRMIVSGLAFLLMGAVFLIRHVIEASELETREKLLELEYRLAELTEALKLERPAPPSRS